MTEDVRQRDHKTIRGAIAYTSTKPDRMNQDRGREYFVVNIHADGTRTIMANCQIDDRPAVMRNINYTLDGDWMPKDCFVRIGVDDKFMGTGWFRFASNYAECETFTALEGRVSQRYDLDGPLVLFQNHAIACDAWHFYHYDRVKRGHQSITPMLLSSPDHRGATGPMLYPITMGMDYQGEEQITVKAGTFDAHHFQFVGAEGLPEEHPIYDVWCTSDGNFTFLLGTVGGYMQTHYELVEYEEVEFG